VGQGGRGGEQEARRARKSQENEAGEEEVEGDQRNKRMQNESRHFSTMKPAIVFFEEFFLITKATQIR
jgi:hypothetical protein